MQFNFPYSLLELFNPNAHTRAGELRQAALDMCEGDHDRVSSFLCAPNRALGGMRPLDMSVESPDGHAKAMQLIGAIKYSVHL